MKTEEEIFDLIMEKGLNKSGRIEVLKEFLKSAFDDGYYKGKEDGYDAGYNDGEGEGYDEGYSDGSEDEKNDLE